MVLHPQVRLFGTQTRKVRLEQRPEPPLGDPTFTVVS